MSNPYANQILEKMTLDRALENNPISDEEIHFGRDLGGLISYEQTTEGVGVEKKTLVVRTVSTPTLAIIEILDNNEDVAYQLLPDGSQNFAGTTISVAEFQRLSGVTGNIQTQIDGIHSTSDTIDAIEALPDATPVSTDRLVFSDAGVLRLVEMSSINENMLPEIKTYIDGQDHDHATPIAAHAATSGAHHTRYADSEAIDAVEAVGTAVAIAPTSDYIIFSDNGVLQKYLINNIDENDLPAVKAYIDGLDHHTKYTDAEAVDAVEAVDSAALAASTDYVLFVTSGGVAQRILFSGIDENDLTAIKSYVDGQDYDHATPIAAHAATSGAHHTRYADSEAVDALEAVDVGSTAVSSDHLLMVTAAGVAQRILFSNVDENDLTAIKSYVDGLDHHTKYTNAEAVDAIEAVGTATPVSTDTVVFSDAGVLKRVAFSGLTHAILSGLGGKYTDAEAVSAVEAESTLTLNTVEVTDLVHDPFSNEFSLGVGKGVFSNDDGWTCDLISVDADTSVDAYVRMQNTGTAGDGEVGGLIDITTDLRLIKALNSNKTLTITNIKMTIDADSSSDIEIRLFAQDGTTDSYTAEAGAGETGSKEELTYNVADTTFDFSDSISIALVANYQGTPVDYKIYGFTVVYTLT